MEKVGETRVPGPESNSRLTNCSPLSNSSGVSWPKTTGSLSANLGEVRLAVMLRIWLLVFLALACVLTYVNLRRDGQFSGQQRIEQLGGFIDHGGRVIVLGGREINDAAIRHLRQFPQLEYLALADTTITANGLAILGEMEALISLDLLRTPVTPAFCGRLESMSKLKVLRMSQTSATDECMQGVGRLASLEELDLSHCPVASGGISNLLPLARLRTLILSATNVDDECVAHLAKMPQLRRVDVDHTRLTPVGRRELHDALPDCKIGY